MFGIQEFLRPLFLQRVHGVDDGSRVPDQVDHVEVVSTDPPLLRQLLQDARHLSHGEADCLYDPGDHQIIKYQAGASLLTRSMSPVLEKVVF